MNIIKQINESITEIQNNKYSKLFKKFPFNIQQQASPNLEAILVLVTEQEYLKGNLDQLLEYFKTEPESDLDCVIMFNKKWDWNTWKQNLVLPFKNVIVTSANISPADDIYVKNQIIDIITPRYGYVSGPNLLYLNGMRFCKMYNTVLLLETDCHCKPGWISKMKQYTSSVGDFLIAGSRYKGNVILSAEHGYQHHINGVALYRTGSEIFQKMLNYLDGMILNNVLKGDVRLPYDIAWIRMILEQVKRTSEWKWVFHQTIECPLILNVSAPEDSHIPVSQLEMLYPSHVIRHQK